MTNTTPLGEMAVWFLDAHKQILELAESQSQAQLDWQPHPLANSIAFQLWHLARSADYVHACLSNATAELQSRLGTREQIWLAEGYAAQWGLDPALLGKLELGWEMTPEDAVRMRFPGKDALLDYTRRSFAAEEETVAALDEAQFESLRLHDWAKDQTVGNFLMEHFLHEREHLGAMQYMQGLQRMQEAAS